MVNYDCAIMKRIEWVPPSQTLEHFYYDEVPTRALSKKHFEYYKEAHSFLDSLENYEMYLKKLSEHDAIHYLMKLGFSDNAEKRAVTIEMHCNVGWYSVHPEYNTFHNSRIKFEIPKGMGRTLILETAEKLRDLY
jgi:hypothetical protein